MCNNAAPGLFFGGSMKAGRFILVAEMGAALNAVKDRVQIRIDGKCDRNVQKGLRWSGQATRVLTRGVWFSINDRLSPLTPLAKREAKLIHIDRTLHGDAPASGT